MVVGDLAPRLPRIVDGFLGIAPVAPRLEVFLSRGILGSAMSATGPADRVPLLESGGTPGPLGAVLELAVGSVPNTKSPKSLRIWVKPFFGAVDVVGFRAIDLPRDAIGLFGA